MTEHATHGEILTREEMSLLLESLEKTRREAEDRARILLGATREDTLGDGRLRKAFQTGLSAYAEGLSFRFQTRIAINVLGIQSGVLGDLAEMLLAHDRALIMPTGPEQIRGALVLNRSLFYGWLSLVFGAPPGSHVRDAGLAPRPYTRIEERMLAYFGRELVEIVERSLPLSQPATLGSFVAGDAQDLLEDGETAVALVHAEVSGLGEQGRLRLAWPSADLESRDDGPVETGGPGLRASVLEAPLELRVEAGQTDVRLTRLARMQPGEVLFLDGSPGDALIVRVEGKPLFEATRGSVGSRQAVQITSALAKPGVDQHG